jgi:SAM-dependent methyltransferase
MTKEPSDEVVSRRPCPACSGHAVRHVHSMRFALPHSSPLPECYALVVCSGCGCAFADSGASASDYLTYYAEYSKYEDPSVATGGGHEDCDAARLADLASQLARFAPAGARVLDVGCGNGGLLVELRKRGYLDVTGVDPSQNCIDRIRSLGFDGIQATLPLGVDLESAQDKTPFDLIVLSHVLEHVFDARTVLGSLKTLLAPKGSIYIEVPDPTGYGPAFPPLYFLDAEHINHFSEFSLAVLADHVGMRISSTGRKLLRLPNGSEYPAQYAALTAGGSPHLQTPERNDNLFGVLRRYVDDGRAATEQVRERLLGLVGDGTPFVLWGAGSLSQRLLGEPWFPVDSLLGVVDRDSRKHGLQFAGCTVTSPELGLRGLPADTIVLCAAAIAAGQIESSYRKMGLSYPFHSIASE